MVVTLLIVGCGQRGTTYSRYALCHPDKAKVVGIAEPRALQRERMEKMHGSPDGDDKLQVFTDWKSAAAVPKFADAVVIATLDAMHTEPAVAFAKLGYSILVEKPMAVAEEDCRTIAEAVQATPGLIFCVGHVLRYSPYSTVMKRIVDSGAIGEVLSMQHLEPVGHWHFAHSYVRGNWHKQADSSFVLMAKSCHDIDWMPWMIGGKVSKVSSFGSLSHFRPESKPEGAADRCLECRVAADCPYSAQKVYIQPAEEGNFKWPVDVVTAEGNVDAVRRAIETGPYGRCVYSAGNDQPDHQVVNMQFEGSGATASFSMVSTTKLLCERQTRIFGSKGEIEGDFTTIRVHDFVTGETTVHKPYEDPELAAPKEANMDGHGGGDYGLMHAFVAAVEAKDQSLVLSGPQETLESHLITFAAEKSRLENKVIDVRSFVNKQ